MNTDDLFQKYLTEVRERVDKATLGPWVSYIEARDHTSGDSFIMRGPQENRQDDLYLTGATEADQDFIAHARQDIPILLDEIERLQKDIQRYQSG